VKTGYDIVIIGAGPAGLMAAKTAAENGLSVALLERKETAHDILRLCGMMLVTLSGTYMGERVIHNEEKGLLCFPHHGFNVQYDGPTKDFFSWELYSPRGEKIVFGDYASNIQKGKAGRASAVYDKSWFLNGLLEECRKLGVHVFTGEDVIDVKKVGDFVHVQTAKGRSFRGAFAIAADGRVSRTARVLGLNEKRGFFGTVASWAYEMTNLNLANPYALHQPLVRSGDPPMLCFIMPRAWDHHGEDVWLVMVGSVNPETDFEGTFDYVTKKSRFSAWFKNAKRIKRRGVVGNVYGPIFHPFKDNVIFVGDAGWCQEAEMTGAVMCGWKAANTVTFALQEGMPNEEGIKPYIEWWKTHYLDKMDYNVFLKNLLMPILCSDNEIDYVFSKINETLPTVLDPYEVPTHMGQAMAKIIPEIQAERPELIKKLEMFSSYPTRLLLRKTIRAGFSGSFTI
jgi:flavin-dependent dehydrogenase